jgi:hypothetical protein
VSRARSSGPPRRRRDDIGEIRTLATQLASAAAELEQTAHADFAGDIPYWCKAVLAAVESLTANPRARGGAADARRPVSALADGMRFEFLYDRRRRIFSIGYRLADAHGPGRLDTSFYDLLASEARLASFVAIVKGTFRSTTGSISGASSRT